MIGKCLDMEKKEKTVNKFVTKASALIFSVILAGACLLVSPGNAQANDAKSNYDTKCAVCHAKDGSGKTPMGKKMGLRDLRSKAVQKIPDKEIYDIIAKGKGAMPGYADQLSKEEMEGLVKFIRELPKGK